MHKSTQVYKPKINVTIDPEVFLPVYQHLIESKNNIEFLYGSRDSGKSRHIAQVLVTICMAHPKFKCPMIRKVANTVLDSQYALIKQVCEEWKVDHLFKFTTSPQPKIVCANGGSFLGRGMDDAKKIKSLTDPTHAWIEEGSDLEEDDWTIITTSLRSNNAQTQIWYSFNPDVPMQAYEEFFLYKRYFCDANGTPIPELTFTRTITETIINPKTGLEETMKLTYGCTHSTFYDNPYCPPSRKIMYENLAKTSEYYYRVYCLGLWGRRKTGGEFLREFQSNVHAKDFIAYDPFSTVHISLDSNVYPHIAITVWQLEKLNEEHELDFWDVKQIHELPAADPENIASAAGRKIVRWLHSIDYQSTVFLYGDKSTKARNNIDDAKRSFFQIIQEAIIVAGWKVEDRILSNPPPVRSMGDFVNDMLAGNLDFAQIRISRTNLQSINDYLETKTDKDGAILKVRKADYDGGPSYEHFGHLTDTLKDFIYQAFWQEYASYVNRHNTLKPGGISAINRESKITF